MCKVEQIGNKHVVNKGSITWKNTDGITPANRHVAPSLRAAGSISDGGVRDYWWKCRNWPSKLQKKKSSVQYFTSYLLFFLFRSLSPSVTHRFTAIKFSQRVLFLPQRCLKVLFTLSQNPFSFLFKYIDREKEGWKKSHSGPLVFCAPHLRPDLRGNTVKVPDVHRLHLTKWTN